MYPRESTLEPEMAVPDLLFETTGPVATLTFNKPDKANALDPAWLPAIAEFFGDIDADPDVRCVLLRANGKHFMAGGDLGTVEETMKLAPHRRAALVSAPIHQYNLLAEIMQGLSKPIVASVQGAVAGAAVGLVAACDLVIAADTTFFFVPHVLHGGSVDGLTTYFLPRQIGVKKTLELALLGDRIAAAEAQRLGLINFVVPAADLVAETSKLVDRLANGPTRAYALIRRQILKSLDNSIEQQGSLEADSYGRAAMTDDWSEGIRSFLDKRKAKFTGR
jgi:2-(1,2-epoxy-1,2-dihydrophenyl)acetyl-CoA isomerase